MANAKGKIKVKVEADKSKKKFTPKMSSNKGGILTAKVVASIKKAKEKK